MNWSLWAKGAVSAVISGASSSVASWMALNVVSPDMMQNLNTVGTLKLMGTVALFSGLAGLVNFLKQSPLPNGEVK